MTQFRGNRSVKSIMQNVPETPRITWKRKRMNNTVEYATEDGSRYIRLHDTNIISYLPNGDIVLDSGGWQTPTTKDRMNRYLTEGIIHQEDSMWYLTMINDTVGKEVFAYKDGMTIYRDYVDDNSYTIKVRGDAKTSDLKVLKKKIKAYVDGYMTELFSGNLEAPSGADCWFCSMYTAYNESLGEATRDPQHLLEHFKEKYYVPSLVVNAINDVQVSRAAKHHLSFLFQMHDQKIEYFEDVAHSQIKSSLTRFLRKQLGLAR